MPLAALAAGSMSPDLPYFQPLIDYRLMSPPTHSILGIFTWDLVFGLVMWAAWRIGATAIYDLAPDFVRKRWTPTSWPSTANSWLLIVLAVLIGSVTHVLWDEFTHINRFGTEHFHILAASYSTPFGTLAGYRLLQYASGVVGLSIIVWIGLRQPLRVPGPRSRPSLARATAWLVPVAGLICAGVRLWVVNPDGLRSAAFIGITGGLGGAMAVLMVIVCCHALAGDPNQT